MERERRVRGKRVKCVCVKGLCSCVEMRVYLFNVYFFLLFNIISSSAGFEFTFIIEFDIYILNLWCLIVFLPALLLHDKKD